MADFLGNDASDPNQSLPPPYLYNQYDPRREFYSRLKNTPGNYYNPNQGNSGYSAAQQAFNGPVNDALSAYQNMPGMYQGISNNIGQGLRAMAGIARQRQLQNAYQQQQNAANQANEARYNQVGGFNEYKYNGQMVNPSGTNIPAGHFQQDTSPAGVKALNQTVGSASNYAPMAGGYYGLRARSLNDMSDLESQQNSGYQNLVRGYQARAQRGGQMANAAFLQQRNDINYDAAKQQDAELAGLASSGLTGSTVSASVRQNMAGAKARALGGVADEQARLRMGSDAQLSGDVLNAQNASLQNQQQMKKLKMLTDQSLSGDMLNFATNRNDRAPNPYLLAQISQQLGQGVGSLYGGYGGGYPGA